MSTDDDNLLVLKTLNGTQECNIVSPKHILCIRKKFINRNFFYYFGIGWYQRKDLD